MPRRCPSFPAQRRDRRSQRRTPSGPVQRPELRLPLYDPIPRPGVGEKPPDTKKPPRGVAIIQL
ncbi:MAG TPA: hypothetical protein VJH24_05010 [Candidatus Bilamarchaeaceae archaeon]|nr:hypothetical protein [Candidatus Bilamarchaeaceae archaeon]